MRKISFKGKRVDNNEWEYGYLCRYGFAGKEKYYIIPYYASDLYGIEVDPETVGQFTGLTDKNGEKIFEGDVIQQTNLYDNLEMTGVVVFSKSSQFVIHHTYTKNENIFKAGIKKHFAIRSNCRIIGNIHNNPELLEVEE